MAIKGRLTGVCTDPALWLARPPPFTPSASTLILWDWCEAEEMPQGLSLWNPAVACQQARQLEWGCLQRLCGQAEPDFRRFWPPDQTWEEPFHVLNTLVSVCQEHRTCPLLQLRPMGCSMRLTKAQTVLHLFKIHRSIARSQPGRNGLGEELAATERSQVSSEKLLTVLSCSRFSSLSFSHVFLLVLINAIFEAWMRILPAWTRLYNVGVSRL